MIINFKYQCFQFRMQIIFKLQLSNQVQVQQFAQPDKFTQVINFMIIRSKIQQSILLPLVIFTIICCGLAVALPTFLYLSKLSGIDSSQTSETSCSSQYNNNKLSRSKIIYMVSFVMSLIQALLWIVFLIYGLVVLRRNKIVENKNSIQENTERNQLIQQQAHEVFNKEYKLTSYAITKPNVVIAYIFLSVAILCNTSSFGEMLGVLFSTFQCKGYIDMNIGTACGISGGLLVCEAVCMLIWQVLKYRIHKQDYIAMKEEQEQILRNSKKGELQNEKVTRMSQKLEEKQILGVAEGRQDKKESIKQEQYKISDISKQKKEKQKMMYIANLKRKDLQSQGRKEDLSKQKKEENEKGAQREEQTQNEKSKHKQIKQRQKQLQIQMVAYKPARMQKQIQSNKPPEITKKAAETRKQSSKENPKQAQLDPANLKSKLQPVTHTHTHKHISANGNANGNANNSTNGNIKGNAYTKKQSQALRKQGQKEEKGKVEQKLGSQKQKQKDRATKQKQKQKKQPNKQKEKVNQRFYQTNVIEDNELEMRQGLLAKRYEEPRFILGSQRIPSQSEYTSIKLVYDKQQDHINNSNYNSKREPQKPSKFSKNQKPDVANDIIELKDYENPFGRQKSHQILADLKHQEKKKQIQIEVEQFEKSLEQQDKKDEQISSSIVMKVDENNYVSFSPIKQQEKQTPKSNKDNIQIQLISSIAKEKKKQMNEPSPTKLVSKYVPKFKRRQQAQQKNFQSSFFQEPIIKNQTKQTYMDYMRKLNENYNQLRQQTESSRDIFNSNSGQLSEYSKSSVLKTGRKRPELKPSISQLKLKQEETKYYESIKQKPMSIRSETNFKKKQEAINLHKKITKQLNSRTERNAAERNLQQSTIKVSTPKKEKRNSKSISKISQLWNFIREKYAN